MKAQMSTEEQPNEKANLWETAELDDKVERLSVTNPGLFTKIWVQRCSAKAYSIQVPKQIFYKCIFCDFACVTFLYANLMYIQAATKNNHTTKTRIKSKVEGEGHPTTCHEGTERE
jgi:hypothetical protein